MQSYGSFYLVLVFNFILQFTAELQNEVKELQEEFLELQELLGFYRTAF